MNDLIQKLTLIYLDKVATSELTEDDFVKLYLKTYDAINKSYNENHINKISSKFFKEGI